MTTPHVGQIHVSGELPRYYIALGVETTYSYDSLRHVVKVRCRNVFIQSWRYCSYEHTEPLDYFMSKYSPHD